MIEHDLKSRIHVDGVEGYGSRETRAGHGAVLKGAGLQRQDGYITI